jgi:hypothetical protein
VIIDFFARVLSQPDVHVIRRPSRQVGERMIRRKI